MISIIIPTYKNIKLLHDALSSIIMQDFTDYEIIIVDDTPDDSIEKCLINYNNLNIKFFHNCPAKGAVNNWNYGLSLAKGEKLILMHHDESFAFKNYLKQVDAYLNIYDVIISNKKVFVQNVEKKEHISDFSKKMVLRLKYPLLAKNVIGPCACVAFRKELLDYFDNRMHWKVDVDWYFRLLCGAKSIKYLNAKNIISNHGHADQITSNIDVVKADSLDTEIMINKYNSIFVNVILRVGQTIRNLKRGIRNIMKKVRNKIETM